MNELNQLYQAVLLALGNKIYPTGKVVCVISGTEYPLRIDARDLYIPISEALNTETEKKVFFHPTCENIISKETEVFKLLRRMTSIRLISVFRSMIPVLFEVASKKEKKGWNQAVFDVVTPLAGVKKTTRDEVFAFVARFAVEVEDQVDNRFIHFKVTKGGKGERGERVYYKAKPQFPVYDILVREYARSEGQAKNAVITVNNFSISREAVEILIHLFRFIIPATNNPDSAEFDATEQVAARFTAYMSCVANIAEQINRSQNMFRGDFDKKSIYTIDTSWVEQLENIPEFYRQVPEMEYNSHNVHKNDEQQNQAISGMGGFLTINSNGQQVNGNFSTPTPSSNNAEIRIVNGEEYVMTVPPMLFGDRYVRSDVNVSTRRVNHTALDTMNQQVIYACSRLGNFIQRENQPQIHGYQPMQQPIYQQPQPQQVFVDQYGRQVIQQPQQIQQQQYYQPIQQNYVQQQQNTGPAQVEAFESSW